MTTMHIRRPLRRARGSQWYRDRSDRGQGTFCGGAEGLYDIPARERQPVRYELPGTDRVVCAACSTAREREAGR